MTENNLWLPIDLKVIKKQGGNHIMTQFFTLQTSNFKMTLNVLNRVNSILANRIALKNGKS